MFGFHQIVEYDKMVFYFLPLSVLKAFLLILLIIYVFNVEKIVQSATVLIAKFVKSIMLLIKIKSIAHLFFKSDYHLMDVHFSRKKMDSLNVNFVIQLGNSLSSVKIKDVLVELIFLWTSPQMLVNKYVVMVSLLIINVTTTTQKIMMVVTVNANSNQDFNVMSHKVPHNATALMNCFIKSSQSPKPTTMILRQV